MMSDCAELDPLAGAYLDAEAIAARAMDDMTLKLASSLELLNQLIESGDDIKEDISLMTWRYYRTELVNYLDATRRYREKLLTQPSSSPKQN